MSAIIHRGDMAAWAVFSGCERYRYELGRRFVVPPWMDERLIVWCMLNPSTATELVLDPTLTRVADFSRAWGYQGFVVVNAYAFRATDPKELPRLDRKLSGRAIGPGNDLIIECWATGRDVVVGWGTHCDDARAQFLYRALKGALNVDCLGTNKDGSPKHPLYLAATTTRRPWMPET